MKHGNNQSQSLMKLQSLRKVVGFALTVRKTRNQNNNVVSFLAKDYITNLAFREKSLERPNKEPHKIKKTHKINQPQEVNQPQDNQLPAPPESPPNTSAESPPNTSGGANAGDQYTGPAVCVDIPLLKPTADFLKNVDDVVLLDPTTHEQLHTKRPTNAKGPSKVIYQHFKIVDIPQSVKNKINQELDALAAQYTCGNLSRLSSCMSQVWF